MVHVHVWGLWNVCVGLISLVQGPRNANGTNLDTPERRSGALRQA